MSLFYHPPLLFTWDEVSDFPQVLKSVMFSPKMMGNVWVRHFYSALLSRSYLEAPLHLLLHPGDKKVLLGLFWGWDGWTLCEGLEKGPGWTQGSLPPEKLTWLYLLSLWAFPVGISLQGTLWEGQDRSGKRQGRDRQQ